MPVKAWGIVVFFLRPSVSLITVGLQRRRRVQKMIKFENECVGCPPNMGCLGSGCPYSHVPYLFCDKCGSDAEVLYNTEEGQLCSECVTGDVEDYEVINEDNVYDFASPEEEDDYYDYADLAYEMKRDERYEDG